VQDVNRDGMITRDVLPESVMSLGSDRNEQVVPVALASYAMATLSCGGGSGTPKNTYVYVAEIRMSTDTDWIAAVAQFRV
jgi:hypothetical protein